MNYLINVFLLVVIIMKVDLLSADPEFKMQYSRTPMSGIEEITSLERDKHISERH